MARIITVTSGKGGVGKTNLSVNMAVQMAMEGLRPCVFDADLGLANINILLGIRPEFDLVEVINGERSLSDIIIHDPSGIDIVPGGTGIEKLVALDNAVLTSLASSFSSLDGYDVLIFDTSAGISREVLSFCMASMEVVLVIIPEPTSLTDAYSLLKVLSLNGYREPIKIVVNQAKNERFAQVVYEKFNETVLKYLPLTLQYIGELPADESVAEAVTRQRPFVTLYPNGRAATGMKRLVHRLMEGSSLSAGQKHLDAFWDKYSQALLKPLQLPNKPKESQSTTLRTVRAETKQPAISVPATAASEPSISLRILDSLNQLLTTTADISRELSEFRKTMDKLGVSLNSSGNASGTSESSQLPPVVTLDFEAYVERRRNKANTGSV
jgi:flagellar biosynthesis protein FlhG